MITIKTRTERNNNEDRIHIGMLVEKALQGEFGDYINCLFEGIERAIVFESREGKISAERYLGKIDTLWTLRDEFLLVRQIKDQLLADIKDDTKVGSADEE